MEKIKDENLKSEFSPKIEKLKKKLTQLWKDNFIKERRSALKGFVKEFIIHGDDSISPMHFYERVKPLVVDLLNENPKTKVKLILHVEMIKYDLKTEEVDEADPFFQCHYSPNPQEGNKEEIYDGMVEETIINFENFNKNESN